jgi:hypothetical protein
MHYEFDIIIYLYIIVYQYNNIYKLMFYFILNINVCLLTAKHL